ncbi:putative bifunctional diguanylate cyclase/phosphodiesterase [Marinobacter xestospongiae]|uniref:EAL domain-containing protein n=1 Tax=Marinobacter xestospongiae TaxID=994319 RepID=A0ABU3VSF1_9GAMM|nr:EAL domain-containing protein [Marinobacter xestospongiae]MDV2077200.1 EAL domain-containing protein [Marinobacter xestospongiae]
MSDSRLFTDFHERLMKLSHSTEFINESRDRKLAALTTMCATALDVERVSVWHLSHGHDRLTCEHLCIDGDTVVQDKALELHAREHPRYFEALGRARLIDANDAPHDKRTASFARDYLIPMGIQSMLDAPVFDGARPSGVICLEALQHREWTLPELSFVVAIADTISLINTHTAWLESKRKLDYLTHYDSLTGLPNLHSLRDRVEYLVSKANRRRQGPFALLWLDLDRLKTINDGLGPQVGDQVIAETGERLSNLQINGKYLLARIGGDEFALLLRASGDGHGLDGLVKQVQQSIQAPFVLQDQHLSLTASLGICRYPDHGHDAETLLRSAEAAMYHAKKRGQGQACWFDSSIQITARSRFALERDLRYAILNDELTVHYQPIFDGTGKLMVSAEALVRWQHPERGMLPPIEFLEVARGAGLMNELGDCVLRQVCRDIQVARERQQPLPVISVNLAAEQVLTAELPERVAAVCKNFGVSPQALQFEVTEDAIQGDSQTLRTTLTQLVAAGSELAIDDFGTGYSSLARLKSLPFSRIKIDRSFIRDIPTDEDDCAITLSIIGLAKGLGLSLVAEGVESLEHEQWLQSHHCDYLQGYRYSRPVCFDDLCNHFLDDLPRPAQDYQI